METKQTAVEYLQRMYFKTGMLYRTDFEKAKQMEDEQKFGEKFGQKFGGKDE